MAFQKGDPIDVASYIAYHAANPTYSKDGKLVTGLFGTGDKSSGKIGFRTRSISTVARPYNIVVNFKYALGALGVTSSFRIFDSDEETILFEIEEGETTASTNTEGWDYEAVVTLPGAGFEETDLVLHIPPADTKYYWEFLLPGALLNASTMIWDIKLYQAQNDMVPGDKVRKWKADFSAFETVSNEDGLSYNIAKKGLYGGE